MDHEKVSMFSSTLVRRNGLWLCDAMSKPTLSDSKIHVSRVRVNSALALKGMRAEEPVDDRF